MPTINEALYQKAAGAGWSAIFDDPCLMCADLDCILNGCRRKRSQEAEADGQDR